MNKSENNSQQGQGAKIPENLMILYEQYSNLIGHNVKLTLSGIPKREVTGVITEIKADAEKNPDDLMYVVKTKDRIEEIEIMNGVETYFDLGPTDS